jgi:hypothetical protein
MKALEDFRSIALQTIMTSQNQQCNDQSSTNSDGPRDITLDDLVDMSALSTESEDMDLTTISPSIPPLVTKLENSDASRKSTSTRWTIIPKYAFRQGKNRTSMDGKETASAFRASARINSKKGGISTMLHQPTTGFQISPELRGIKSLNDTSKSNDHPKYFRVNDGEGDWESILSFE